MKRSESIANLLLQKHKSPRLGLSPHLSSAKEPTTTTAKKLPRIAYVKNRPPHPGIPLPLPRPLRVASTTSRKKKKKKKNLAHLYRKRKYYWYPERLQTATRLHGLRWRIFPCFLSACCRHWEIPTYSQLPCRRHTKSATLQHTQQAEIQANIYTYIQKGKK